MATFHLIIHILRFSYLLNCVAQFISFVSTRVIIVSLFCEIIISSRSLFLYIMLAYRSACKAFWKHRLKKYPNETFYIMRSRAHDTFVAPSLVQKKKKKNKICTVCYICTESPILPADSWKKVTRVATFWGRGREANETKAKELYWDFFTLIKRKLLRKMIYYCIVIVIANLWHNKKYCYKLATISTSCIYVG